MHITDLYNTRFLHSYQILVFMHRYVHRNKLPTSDNVRVVYLLQLLGYSKCYCRRRLYGGQWSASSQAIGEKDVHLSAGGRLQDVVQQSVWPSALTNDWAGTYEPFPARPHYD